MSQRCDLWVETYRRQRGNQIGIVRGFQDVKGECLLDALKEQKEVVWLQYCEQKGKTRE